MNPIWRIILDVFTLLLAMVGAGIVAWMSLRKSADPAKLVFKWIITAGMIMMPILMVPHYPPKLWIAIVLPPCLVLGLMWAPAVGSLLVSPITNAIDGGDVQMEAQPFYSIAETKRRNGHPQEAIAVVREQLEKFPGDFRGTMLLATIQVEDMNDLPGAQITLERWMDRSEATPQGKASALTAIADWHLQFAQDPEAARMALERIVNELPDTPVAHQAAQRLAHLPTAEHLVALRTGTKLDLRPGEKNVGLLKDFTGAAPAGPDPAALADEYVKQLEKHPADTSTREKLAVLYADHFQRLDLATDQLEQLIAFPNETPRHIVQWLNLLADLQIRVGKDLAGAEATLRRVVERFPSPALVEPTMARLASLQGEMKGGRTSQVKTMGHYEKNLGLKQAKG